MSQDQLAASAGYTQGMVSHWETGATDYTGTNLVNLAKALNCETRDLLYRHPSVDEDIAAIIETLPLTDRAQVLEIAKTFKRARGGDE
jgi:transcriptional regulator with XRE-family HTH domain